jgi:Tol biopolymer transport system component/DNA-binding winged helix-turn-helix (wHTH) protein
MSTLETYETYEFGGFCLDPRRRVLSRLGKTIALKPKVFDTLLFLVEHAGKPLDKSALLAAIWPNLVVEENNLNKTISVLRRVLGETPDEHRFIVTEPGRGYRFVAHVSRSPAAARVEPLTAGTHDDVPSGASRWRKVGYAAAGAFAMAIVLVLLRSYAPPQPADSPPRPATRFRIDTAPTLNPLNMALSRDGREIAYVGQAEFGSAIWVRSLGAIEARPLPGTEGATETAYPFWSPDGRYIAFRSGMQLKRIDVANGAVETIFDGISLFRRGAWGPDGTILFATEEVIHRVPVTGGEASSVTTLDSPAGEVCHSAPHFLPDGRHFLYKATNVNRRNGTIYVAALDSAESPKRLLEASRAVYVEPGFIVYTRGHALFARPFDAARLEFTGEPTQIADDIVYREILDTSAFDAADDGTLIYRREREPDAPAPLVWIDRSGTTRAGGPSIARADFELSPLGTQIAFAEGIAPDVWTVDLARGARARLTSDPQVDHNPIWSPDGTAIAFDSHRQGSRGIFVKRADGAVDERGLLDAGAHDVRVTDWSADGRLIVFEQDSCVGCAYDIWLLPTGEGGQPFPYIETDFDERSARLSPDGRWIAYMTSESGIYEVVVQSFPDPAKSKRQVSANGGSAPRWARGGQELYYYDLTGSIVRVPIGDGHALEIGEPVRVAAAPSANRWGVTADGERLLIAAPEGERVLLTGPIGVYEVSTASETRFPMDVTLNWTSLLAR